MQWSEADRVAMARAIELSKQGFPAPNPHVGCVIVRDGLILGEGYHDHAGGLHAEAQALRNAGDVAGADVFVTLEPCSHHGRQPPCTDALIAAGVRRVVIACADPNPKAGGGSERLRAAHIEVSEGLLEAEASAANRQFLFAFRHQRPWVVAKAAISLDGRIALPNGDSQWITSFASRREAHRLRAALGAVLVGRRTVELDDPLLTARIDGVQNQPVRIVLDPEHRLSGRERIFGHDAPTRHVTGPIDLPDLLSELFAAGITGLLVEGGAITLGRFVQAGLVDRYEVFMAPKLLGEGPSWLNAALGSRIDDCPRLRPVEVRQIEGDIWLTLEPGTGETISEGGRLIE